MTFFSKFHSFVSSAILLRSQPNFPKLVSWPGSQRWVTNNPKNQTPLGAAPTPHPHVRNIAISRPIMNRSVQNFQGSFPWLVSTEQAKKIPKYVAPSWGNPIPQNVSYLTISRPITKRFLRYFQELAYLLGDNEWPQNHLIYVTPSWVGNYPPYSAPHILKRDISWPIMKRFLRNFQRLVS